MLTNESCYGVGGSSGRADTQEMVKLSLKFSCDRTGRSFNKRTVRREREIGKLLRRKNDAGNEVTHVRHPCRLIETRNLVNNFLFCHVTSQMSLITIRNVEFLNNPAPFQDPYRFRVTFECIGPLSDDIEWRLIYVSSPGDVDLDQELDDCLVGPVPVGVNSFQFECMPPDPTKIPTEDVLGVAALILTASYRDQEFVRVGYYQNTEYDNDEMKENPPQKIIFDRLVRDINAKPRVTRLQIKW